MTILMCRGFGCITSIQNKSLVHALQLRITSFNSDAHRLRFFSPNPQNPGWKVVLRKEVCSQRVVLGAKMLTIPFWVPV